MTVIPSVRRRLAIAAYAAANRHGFLRTSAGRWLFSRAYFAYKRRFGNDPFQDLQRTLPSLFQGGDVLDLGANVGYATLIFARAVDPGRKVYAFEPEPQNFAILSENVRRARLEGTVVPIRAAVGSADGRIDLHVNERDHGDHRIATEAYLRTAPSGRALAVDVVTVDSFLDRLGGERRIAFIKIDVQGHELEVCRGMRGTIARTPDLVLALEYWPRASRELGFVPSDVFGFLGELGLRFAWPDRSGKLMPASPRDVEEIAARRGHVDFLATRADLWRAGARL